MPQKVLAEGNFGEALDKLMKAQEKSIRQMALETGATYEHIRKMVKGIALPSPILLNNICRTLKWKQSEADKLVVADHIQKKFGQNLPVELTGKDPSIIPFERVIPKLTAVQRKQFLAQMKAVVAMNEK